MSDRVQKTIDHLFRTTYGKMVSSLVRIFGPDQLDAVEDAVQETFLKALSYWRIKGIPENPEGWLLKASKNKTVDWLRKNMPVAFEPSAFNHARYAISIQDVFLESSIRDSQLRMLFMVCHPEIKQEDQLVFALKSFSGFSLKEIANALLRREERIKKSLYRARKKVSEKHISFEFPSGQVLLQRLRNIHLVVYLLFNEGFHSSSKDRLVRKELVAEALRLGGLLVESLEDTDSYALMALMCFHAARLEAKINDRTTLVLLENQDRKLWSQPLIQRGHFYMNKALEQGIISTFHWEAAIAGEHATAKTYRNTRWEYIEKYYYELIALTDSPIHKLNLCVVLMVRENFQKALEWFEALSPEMFSSRKYLYHAVGCELFSLTGRENMAVEHLKLALANVSNDAEKEIIMDKMKKFEFFK